MLLEPCSFCLFTNCTVESRFFSWSLALKGIACWRVIEGCRAESCGCVIRAHALPATSQESTDCAAKKVFHASVGFGNFMWHVHPFLRTKDPFRTIHIVYIYIGKSCSTTLLFTWFLSVHSESSRISYFWNHSQFTPKFSPSSPQASFPCSNPLLCISSAWKSPKRLAAASITLLPSGAHAKRRGKAPGGQDVSICSLA